MKRAIPILAILLIAHCAQAQVAAKLSIADTRDANTLPSGYSQEARFEFKARNVVGVPGEGYYSGMLTIAPWTPDNSGNKFHQLNFNDGGIYYRTAPSYNTPWEAWCKLAIEDANGSLNVGAGEGGGLLIGRPNDPMGLDGGNYSIKFYGYRDVAPNAIAAKIVAERTNHCCGWLAQGSDLAFYTVSLITNSNADNSIERLRIKDNGNVGIGTSNPQNLLDVNGTIRAKEVKVESGWADFVFKPDYQLKPLAEVEQFITTNGHLPEIPTTKEVEQNGVNLGEMNAKLLQKVEELTLYLIDQSKKIDQLSKENRALKRKVDQAISSKVKR
ncbi:hypothetical protein [uncultured Acetobacteroides sp.]|uniref:hypothetical protein n=1 Tax=uncultured Acetobacteroides sp. TaxID=1760811 RepID=UPI0029F56E66|nr:hypothetical protein [uncultured Acetobacteroides sp.]